MITAARAGAVVIGRNEAKRLARGLDSVRAAGLVVVYVDSGSVDDSVAIARSRSDAVVELDPSRAFSAARARNEGLDALRRLHPFEFVMFIDGDCELNPAFPSAALTAMDADPKRAIVTGYLFEQHPETSQFNRLCALEWASPAGDLVNFGALGGIMFARIEDVIAVGGFDADVIAGEDSELGVRMALAGHKVTKIDAAMATHDADILRFGQWWQRAVRAGHALAQRYALHGRSPVKDCAREYRSTLVWGVALPLIILAALVPSGGWSMLLVGGYGVLGWRIFTHYRRSGASWSNALIGARFGLYSKFANAQGVMRYFINRVRGGFRIIEYK